MLDAKNKNDFETEMFFEKIMTGDFPMESRTESLRKRGKPLTQEEKWLVLNVYNRCRDEAKSMNIPITGAYERASYYSGVSRKVVVEIVCHFRKKGTIPPVVKAGNQINHNKLCIILKCCGK